MLVVIYWSNLLAKEVQINTISIIDFIAIDAIILVQGRRIAWIVFDTINCCDDPDIVSKVNEFWNFISHTEREKLF